MSSENAEVQQGEPDFGGSMIVNVKYWRDMRRKCEAYVSMCGSLRNHPELFSEGGSTYIDALRTALSRLKAYGAWEVKVLEDNNLAAFRAVKAKQKEAGQGALAKEEQTEVELRKLAEADKGALNAPSNPTPWAKPTPPVTPVTPASPVTPTNSLDTILSDRGSKYGKFSEHAHLTQAIKEDIQYHMKRNGKEWMNLEPDQREGLEMIAHKIGRIVNGDPNYSDSWHDIAGYAKLVGDRLDGKSK